MTLSDAERVERIEALRIPAQPTAAAHDWKDWAHLVLLQPQLGWRAIANVNLAGGGPDAQLQWTLVVHTPDGRIHGASRAQRWRDGMVTLRPLAVAGEEARFAFDGQQITLAITPHDLDLRLELAAAPASTPLLVTEGAPFGSGFIGWGLLPGVRAAGRLCACGEAVPIDAGWFVYHDRNYGRFRWGEDVGWEWMVAHARTDDGPALTVVVDWRTDRRHAAGGLPYLFVLVDGRLRKLFLGPAMRLRWHWHDVATLPLRLPGTMASLLADRTARRPRAVTLEAADERDRLVLTLEVDAHLEIIAPDNRSSAHARIGEASGAVAIEADLAGTAFAGRGLAYAEYTR